MNCVPAEVRHGILIAVQANGRHWYLVCQAQGRPRANGRPDSMSESRVPFKRILWVGSLLSSNPYGLDGARVRGLQASGCEVATVDRSLVLGALAPLSLRLENRLLRGRATTALNRFAILGARCHQLRQR